MRFLALLLFLPLPVLAAEAPSATTLPSVAVYSYPEDAGAAQIAAKAGELTVRRAAGSGWRAGMDARIGDLLDRSPDDLLRAADALTAGRASLQEGLDEHARLRLEQAQEALLKAKAALLEAAAAPPYGDLRTVHLYLGIVTLNLGQADAADAQFREAAFLSPSAVLSPTQFPPSVIEAYLDSRKKIGAGARGSLKVESDVKGALVLLDGLPKGPTPRVISDIPEGGHYLEVRAPGTLPVLQEVQIQPNAETPLVVSLRSTAAPLRQVWSESRGEGGAAAIARILQVDRVIILSTRTTVAGVSPYALRGAAFDAETRRRAEYAEANTARDTPTTEQRVGAMVATLIRHPRTSGPSGPSLVASTAVRDRFLAPQQMFLVIEAGGAYQDHVYDAQGSFAPATSMDDFCGWRGFNSYFDQRTLLRLKYGFKENVTGVLEVPYYYKSIRFLHIDSGACGGSPTGHNTTTSTTGLGDMTVGFDARVPRFETESLKMVWVSLRATLPTGNSGTRQTLRSFDETIVMGSGQVELYAAIGTMLASETLRSDLEAGYTFRMPGNVDYLGGGSPQYLNIGDEQHLYGDLVTQVGRWLSPGVFLNLTRRDPTKNVEDPVSFDNDSREMQLVELGLSLQAEFSERAEGGARFQYPIYGRITGTLFPLDVTGPIGVLWYGYRF